MMDFGYVPIIAINCTFRSPIPNFSRVIRDSMQARNPKLILYVDWPGETYNGRAL